MRYSSSTLAAVVICLITFLGMSLLVSAPKYKKSTQIEMIDFSQVQDMKETAVKPDKPIEPPKQEKIKQPPAAPKIDVVESPPDRKSIPVPTGIAEISKALITPMALPDITNPGNAFTENRSLTPTLTMQAAYPPEAIRKKIEGWVKVEFTVNEYGMVTNASVIEAQPKRIFNRSAIRSIHKYKFEPLIVDGQAMPQKAVQIIEFKLND